MKAFGGLLLLSALSLSGDDLTEKAERLLGGELFGEVVELLAPEVLSEPEDPQLRDLYSQALVGFGRLDESAHQLQIAINLLAASGDTSAERALRRRVAKIDPEATAVRGFWNKTTDLMGESARNLMAEEQVERAAIYLEGLIPFVGLKERKELKDLLKLAKDKQQELDLGRAETALARAKARLEEFGAAYDVDRAQQAVARAEARLRAAEAEASSRP